MRARRVEQGAYAIDVGAMESGGGSPMGALPSAAAAPFGTAAYTAPPPARRVYTARTNSSNKLLVRPSARSRARCLLARSSLFPTDAF